MSNQLLFHTAEMSEVLQKKFNQATGLSALIDMGEGSQDLNHVYIRWLEIRIYELSGRPQPLPPKEHCNGCNQMVQMEDWASPQPFCPNCIDKD